jgi:arylformamidase
VIRDHIDLAPATLQNMEKKIWDISPPVDEQSAVFPGDAAYAQTLHFALSPDCPVNVHTITLSPHTGAHADAPLHYAAGERTSGELPLAPYIGPCRVIHARLATDASDKRVRLAHVAHALDKLPERVLLHTSARASQSWDDFWAIDDALIDLLAARGVQLVGIDTPSVDPGDSKNLAAHQALLRHDLRVLENLVLDDVPEGDYELIALPLKLMRSDASPVRAVLRSLP